MEQMIQT